MPALAFLDEKMKHHPYRAHLMNGHVAYVGEFMGPDLNSASDLVYAGSLGFLIPVILFMLYPLVIWIKLLRTWAGKVTRES